MLIAGGIGITPMMSVTRSLTDRGWPGQIFLVFAVRKRSDIVFEAELADLQARHPNLHVLVTLTNEPDAAWTGARGYVNAEMLRAFIPDFTRGPVMLCGPDPMMTAARALLVGMGIPDAEVHQEAFVSPPAIVEPGPGDDDPPLPDGEVATITFSAPASPRRSRTRRACSRPPKKPASRFRSSVAPVFAGNARRG